MKESYREGLANHLAPSHVRAVARLHLKRWTGVSVGWVLNSEILRSGLPMASMDQKATLLRAIARARSGPAESKTPCMQRNSKCENRETPSLPTKQHSGPEGERDER